jgi:hypothetical protein
MPSVFEIQQAPEVFGGFNNYIAASTTVASVRPALPMPYLFAAGRPHELIAVKTLAAFAALPRLDLYFNVINEHFLNKII